MKFLCGALALLSFAWITNAFAQNIKDSVIVLPVKVAAPANAKKLGTIKNGNNATTLHCDYEAMIVSAKQKALAMGGNIVKITQLNDPVFISKCYSFNADVYYATGLPDYAQHKDENNTGDTANSSYATLYIYRLQDTLLATGYKVHLNNDSVICYVKSKSREPVKIYKQGMITLWAETEKRQELKLDVKPGSYYYIRCGITNGEIRMVPVLQLVDNTTGAAEYGRLKKKKKDTDRNYLDQIH